MYKILQEKKKNMKQILEKNLRSQSETVRNAHEEHLPSKRVGKSTKTESDVPSTSNKRKKKT